MIVKIYFSIGGAHIIREGNVPDLSQGLTLETFMKVNGLLANVMISFHSHVVLIKVLFKIVGHRKIAKRLLKFNLWILIDLILVHFNYFRPITFKN